MRLLAEQCMERDKLMMDTRGNVFDIQRYSIHDGEGIRTTVFLKGCPLRCKWCANPESWVANPQLFFSESRCIKCGLCSEFEGITMTTDGPQIDRGKLRDIDGIARVCPSGAMSIKGKNMTVAQVMEEIEKDIPFYIKSNGGVTVSGGEALMQAKFVEELFKVCKEKKIHTIIETAGYVDWENFERVLPYTDSFFYDVKLGDSNLHQTYTGVQNAKVISNLEGLIQSGADVCVRIPVIPTVNDNNEELNEIAGILKRCGVSRYELLTFHQYGKGKYKSCDIEYELGELEPITSDAMKKIYEYFKNCMK